MNSCSRITLLPYIRSLRKSIPQRCYSSLQSIPVQNGPRRMLLHPTPVLRLLQLYSATAQQASSQSSSQENANEKQEELHESESNHRQHEQESSEISLDALIALDGGLRLWVPKFFKSFDPSSFPLLDKNVEYEDLIFGYRKTGIQKFFGHLAKVKLYFTLRSLFSNAKHQGSYIHDDGNKVVVLYRLIVQRHFLSWLIYAYRSKEKRIRFVEGALEFFVRETETSYKVYKIINRRITTEDLEQIEPYDPDVKLHEDEILKAIQYSFMQKRVAPEFEQPQQEEDADEKEEEKANKKAATPLKIDL